METRRPGRNSQPGLLCQIHKPHFDRRRRLQHRLRRFHCTRILTLLAVSQAHGCTEFVLRDVLEFLQMLAGVFDVTRLLVGSRQSEFGRRVQWIDFQRVFESFNGLWKLLGLHVRGAQKIPGVGVVRINLNYMLERINRRRRVARVLGEHSQAIPRVRIFRILFERIFEGSLRLIHFLQVEICNALIQSRDCEFGIDLRGLLEGLQSLLEQLLVHVGGAEIVQARCLNWILLRGRRKHAKGGQDSREENG